MTITSPLVSTDWLAARLGDNNIKIIDGSWYLPQMERDPLAEFDAAHIPGAVRFDVNTITDQSTDLPHMLANADVFGEMVGAMGISDTNTIVIYDGMGIFSAPRVWWNFRIMGAQNTYLLSGGLPKWTREGHPTEAGPSTPDAAVFSAQQQPGTVARAQDILPLSDAGAQIVDMRPAPRFRGEVPEPREGLRSGHIPGSFSLPFTDLIVDGQFLDDAALKAQIEGVGIDTSRPIISSCGSGVTATILSLALTQLGVDAMHIYDGSWAEWGADEKLPVDVG